MRLTRLPGLGRISMLSHEECKWIPSCCQTCPTWMLCQKTPASEVVVGSSWIYAFETATTWNPNYTTSGLDPLTADQLTDMLLPVAHNRFSSKPRLYEICRISRLCMYICIYIYTNIRHAHVMSTESLAACYLLDFRSCRWRVSWFMWSLTTDSFWAIPAHRTWPFKVNGSLELSN